jgi:DNA polymerase III subunit alpha
VRLLWRNARDDVRKIDRVLTRAAGIIQDRQKGQDTMFGMLEERAEEPEEPEKQLPEWPQHELLAHEKELLGFYVTGHPLTPYAPILEKYAVHTTSQLASLANRAMTRIGGLVVEVQKGISKKSGKPYAMVLLEDLEGTVQVLCLNENYDKFINLLVPKKALLITGEVNLRGQAQDFSAGNHPAGGRPARLYQAGSSAPANGAPDGQGFGGRAGSGHRPSRQMPAISLPQMARRRSHLHRNPRKIPRQAVAGLAKSVDERFGEETYYAKVDTTLPQRAPRQWEKKSYGGNGED